MDYHFTIHCTGCGAIRSFEIADDTHLSAAQVLAQAVHSEPCSLAKVETKTVEVDASNPKNVVYTIS